MAEAQVDQEEEVKLVPVVLVILRQQLHLKEIQEVVLVLVDLILIHIKAVRAAVVQLKVDKELVVDEKVVMVPHLI